MEICAKIKKDTLKLDAAETIHRRSDSSFDDAKHVYDYICDDDRKANGFIIIINSCAYFDQDKPTLVVMFILISMEINLLLT
ncbi:hypothetical protein CS542_01805 [Pedobacter sp. IW39]|nr:hypothetical protein CS542_01805 [Pedobacter sp. IW39]